MTQMTKGWKQNIPTADYIIGGEQDVPAQNSNSVEGRPKNVDRIAAKVKMTFAMVPTANYAIYLPNEMFDGAPSFLKPFPKPIQVHHMDLADPIGRVTDVRYVDTFNRAIQQHPPIKKAMDVFYNPKSTLLAKLQTVKIFQDAARSVKHFAGVGYIEGLWDVSDPDAAQKVIDKRYLTVSTSFLPQGAYCSQCAREGTVTDWVETECEHIRSEVYDGYPCLAIPHGFDYNEVSPVNHPAASNAMIVEVGHNLTFSDAISQIRRDTTSISASDIVVMSGGKSFKFSDSALSKFPQKLSDLDSDAKSPKIVIENDEKGKPEEDEMKVKLSALLKDKVALLVAINGKLPEGAVALSDADLGSLPEDVFIGPDSTFPVKDAAYADAIKQLLDECEDGDLKTTYLDALEVARLRLEKPEPVVEETPISDSAPVEPETDSKEAPAPEAPLVTPERLKELEDAAAKVEELEIEKATLKFQVDSLRKQLRTSDAASQAIMAEYKDSLANKLLERREALGVKIEDRAEELKRLSARTVSSLKDSISELSSLPGKTPGVNKEEVAPIVDSQTKEVDASQKKLEDFEAIFEQAMNIRFSDKHGEARYKKFVQDQIRTGILPSDISY